MRGGAWTLLAALALLVFGLGGPAAAQECAVDRVDIRGDWGTARFGVEIADDPAEQARGLMFRESLAASAGMLFVYPRPGNPSFWMKNTLIPLDMLFIRPDGTVAHVHSRAVPGDITGIRGGDGILAVLEIRGGMAEALGIGPGDAVRHPAFDGEAAAWACEPVAASDKG
jgi:uncharacterized membrane protein (UPF0127 family)